MQSPFTKLWQSCSNPHLKIRAIAMFAFYSLNYSLAARLQDNSRPKSPTKVETKRELQQFTVFGWLIINGERAIVKKENFKAEIIFNMKCPYHCQLLFEWIIIFIAYRFPLTDPHPKFVYNYKLDISNYKTVPNEKDINNIFNLF